VGRRREPTIDAFEAGVARSYCHCVGLMLFGPMYCGHAHSATSFCGARERITHPDDIMKALCAAKVRAYELWQRADPPTADDRGDLVAMIPATWRDRVASAAEDLRAIGERSRARRGVRA
jgi:hypothetical protein